MESPLRAPAEPDFRLIETLGYHPGEGLRRCDRHLARMARSATAMGIAYDNTAALKCLEQAEGTTALRCRLTLDVAGRFELTTAPLSPSATVWQLAIAPTRLVSTDPWLRHKTTRRAVYDTARANLPAKTDELVFLNENDELCEGTITNLFVVTRDGRQLTPPLRSGLLPGILREELLETAEYTEGALTLTDAIQAQHLFVGNSLRGVIKAELKVE